MWLIPTTGTPGWLGDSGGHGHLGLGSLTENHKVDLLANLVSADQSLDHLAVGRRHAVDRDDQISWQQSVVSGARRW